MNTESVTDLPDPVKDPLQRVWIWRWTCPQAQTVFTVDYPELERVYQESREELRAELDTDSDLEGPVPQLDLPYPGLGQRGGRYVDQHGNPRAQPALNLLLDCVPPNPTRLEIEGPFDRARSSVLLERLAWAWKHTGRPKGLSEEDYAAQKEWTVCRALTWSFFEQLRELPGVPCLWRDLFRDSGPQVRKAASQVLGILLLARRIGRNGMTVDGPELAVILDVSEASVWRALRLLERAGYLIRMRRYKPGRNGRPVALTANWYGFGSRALADLGAIAEPAPVVKRARLKLRRQHLRAAARRLAALPGHGGELLPGYEYPNLEGFLGLTLATWGTARARDERRFAEFQAGGPFTDVDRDGVPDFTTAILPSFVFALGELDVAAELGEVETAEEPAELGEVETAAEIEQLRQAVGELGPVRPPRPPIDRRPRHERMQHLGDLAARRPHTDRAARAAAAVEIPKSGRFGPPGFVKMNLRTGPQASGTGPPQAHVAERTMPPTDAGPPKEPDSTVDRVLTQCLDRLDPTLRRLAENIARIKGFLA